jgi:hypothetical protein
MNKGGMHTEVLTGSALRAAALTSGEGAEGVRGIGSFETDALRYQCVVEVIPYLSR